MTPTNPNRRNQQGSPRNFGQNSQRNARRQQEPAGRIRSQISDRDFTWQGGWATPDLPNDPPPREPPKAAPTRPPQQRSQNRARYASQNAARQRNAAPPPARPDPRTAARRARERRRKQRRQMMLGTAAGILLLSGIITVLLPKDAAQPSPGAGLEEAPATGLLVAPLPYAGGGSGSAASPALDWGTVGPLQQNPGAEQTYVYTAAPAAASELLPEFGRVDTEWFADAAFLGDSITTGFYAANYGINVGGALICGYTGVSPNTIVNRTVVNSADRGDEVPLDVLAAAQPAKLYLLIGTNALVAEGNDEGFLNYYARMLDELRSVLPNTQLYVQSILPVTTEALSSAPGLSPTRLHGINTGIEALCAERGAYFLDLNAEFSDENGALLSEYAQPDGVHITVAGYGKWIDYLCRHVPYNKNNPYQAGSRWYLDDSLKTLLADLP